MLRKRRNGVKENVGNFFQTFLKKKEENNIFEKKLSRKKMKEYCFEVGVEEEQKEIMRMVC